jgi:hypothetical protein
VTTIDAAAAWRGNRSVVFAVFAAVAALGLGGCETGSSLFPAASDPNAALTTSPAPTAPQTAKVAIAPVIGAPDTVARQLQTQLTAAMESQRITVSKAPTDAAEYTVRGYVVSAREKGRTKVSYIWDVTDPAGKRVNRITGEEVLSGAQSKDPWSAVTPQVVDTISSKTAGSLATWLPTQSAVAAGATATPPSASVASTPAPNASSVTAVQTAPTPLSPTPTASATPPSAAGGPTTGSIDRPGPVTAMVPSVTGAPGDGSVALTSAIQRELTKSGVALTAAPSGQTYRVEGKVAVGQAQNGKQPIQIDWDVKDPQGKKLGTVSQKNEIAQGSLDGAWGKTADAAASAAAQGILKLLPKTQVN